MSSADLKQQASAALAKQQQLSVKIGAEQSKLNGIDSEDTMKISAMQNKIEGLKSSHAGLRGEAVTLQNEARAESNKEIKAEFKKLNEDQEKLQKEQTKQQQKIEKELAEKAASESKKNLDRPDLDKDFGEELLFLSDDNGFTEADAEQAVTYIAANPVQQEAEGKTDSAKNNEDEKLIKGAGASATGS